MSSAERLTNASRAVPLVKRSGLVRLLAGNHSLFVVFETVSVLLGAAGLEIAHAASQGVLLFVDLNDAPREIAAAREAAQRRGDRLVVIPEIPAREREELSRLERDIPALEQAMIAFGTRNAVNAARYDATRQTLADSRDRRFRLRMKHSISDKDVKSAVQAIHASGDRLESLILSGHSSGRSYFGDFGDLDTDDLQLALKQPPELSTHLESLYLWGCYTNTMSETLDWRDSLPQLKMIMGFDGKAPSSDRPASYQLLADALSKEARIREARTTQELSRQFRALQHSMITHSSLTVGSCHVSAENPNEVLNVHHAEDCRRTVDSLQTLAQSTYIPFKQAAMRSAYENPPANPAQSPLRNFYNELQRHYHCITLLQLGHTLPKREQVLRLIFFENMRQHFNEAYRQKLERLNAWLASLAPPTPLRYPGLAPARASRAAVQKFVEDFRGLQQSAPAELEDFFRDQVLQSLSRLHCMPLTWVEPLRQGERVPEPRKCTD